MYGDAHLDVSRTKNGEIDILKKYLKSDTIFLDVGANVGFFSCYASSLGCHVVAIEPNILNYKLLCRNIFCNNFKNIEVFCLALSDACEVKPLYGGGQGASLLKGFGDMQSTYSSLVSVTTLDRIVGRKYHQPLFIKIDVEGNEYGVLTGSTETLKRTDCVWMIENGLTENFKELNPHYRDVFNFFWAQGYQSYSIALNKTITDCDVDGWIKHKNAGEENINFIFYRPNHSCPN